MATDEDRAHARRLLEIHQRNLRTLEEQAATYAGDVPLKIANQVEVERANIAALEPIAKPAPSSAIQAFVTGVADGNGGNWAMLFSQFVLLNARMTKQEEQTQRILDEQSRASQWRMTAGHDIDALKTDAYAGERGRRRNLWLLVVSMILPGLALLAALWLVIR